MYENTTGKIPVSGSCPITSYGINKVATGTSHFAKYSNVPHNTSKIFMLN